MNHRIVYEGLGGPEVIRLVEEPDPVPGPGEALVRVRAAGVAFGDVMPRRGVALPAPRFPFTPGYDVVGVVEALGPGAAGVSAGDRVAALPGVGGYQHLLCLPVADLVPVPAGVPDEKAVAAVLNYLTALQLLTRAAGLRAGQRAFAYGLRGGVGSALVEVAREAGIALDGTARGGRLEGAPPGVRLFDRDDPDLARTVRAAVPEGYDAVLDPLGGASLDRSWRLLGPRGRLVMFGAASAAQGGNPRLALAGTMLRVLAYRLRPGGRRLVMYLVLQAKAKRPGEFREDLARLLGWLAQGRIDPLVAEVAPLADAARVQARLERGEVAGKVVLRP